MLRQMKECVPRATLITVDNAILLPYFSGVIRFPLLGVGHIIEDVPSYYLKHTLVVHVINVPINFMGTVVT